MDKSSPTLILQAYLKNHTPAELLAKMGVSITTSCIMCGNEGVYFAFFVEGEKVIFYYLCQECMAKTYNIEGFIDEVERSILQSADSDKSYT